MSSAQPDGHVLFVTGSSDDFGSAAAVAWSGALAARGVPVDAVSLNELPGRGRARIAALAARIDVEYVTAVVGAGTVSNLAAIAARELTIRRPALVATEHDLLTPRRRSADAAVRLAVVRARRVYRRADIVTGSSHALAAEINAGFAVPASRSLVVPNPVLGGEKRPYRRSSETGASGADVHILIAGELVEANGPLRVVEAAGELVRRGLTVRLSARADGPLREAVRTAAATYGLMTSEIGPEIFPHDAVLVLGAAHSGLGDDLIRAAAAGVPSVAVSTALGVADAIVPGITGELAVASDPAAIADAVMAARHLDVRGVDEWLDRFEAAASTEFLCRAIDLAIGRNEAALAAEV